MPRLILTEQAEIDAIETLTFLRTRSLTAADRLEAAFQEKCRLPASFGRGG